MPPKRAVARKRCKLEDESGNGDDSLVQANKSYKKGRTGKLAGLTEMPIDILYEVFSYMSPAELLKLSRMSKAFRRVLMSQSSVSVWRTARENVGLPECPSDMIEPQWANLAFSPHCHYCFTVGVRNVEWRFRMRICAKCAKQHLSETGIMPEVGGVRADLLMPHRRAPKRYKFVYVTADYEKLKVDVSRLGEEDANAYILKKKEVVAKIMTHARQCEEWAKHQNDDRAMVLDRLKEERRNAIVEKLKALGWEKDLESIRRPYSLDDLKVVRAPQRLTERVWSNIQGPILEFMAKMRRRRIDRENSEIIMRRKRTAMTVLQQYKNDRLPYSEVMPEAVDFCDMEPVKAIIHQPLDVSVDAASFAHLTPEFPSLFAAWRSEIRVRLCNVLKQPEEPDIFFDDILGLVFPPPTRPLPETDEEALETLYLASTVFVCNDCGPTLSTLGVGFESAYFYPEVLGHSCLTRRFGCRFMFNDDPVDPSTELVNLPKKRAKWSARSLALSATMQTIAEGIIEQSDLNPAVATAADMDEQDLFYACLSCPSGANDGLTAPVYRWRDAISHEASHHHHGAQWYIVCEDEFDMRRAEIDEDDGERAQFIWCCTRCRDTPEEEERMSLSTMEAHYSIEHQFHDELVLNRDYFRVFDVNKRQHSPLRMYVDIIQTEL